MYEVGAKCEYPAMVPGVRVPLVVTEGHPCSYLPDREETIRAFWAEELESGVYHGLMNAGFRRSGKVVYQPVCRHCRKCLAIRVPVEEFSASKGQRRVWRRNQDLRVEVGPPAATPESFELYEKYRKQWHGAKDSPAVEDFVQFLYESPVETVEFQYRDASNKLLAVGICDVSDESISSVYCYFDPAEAKRGLGTFAALTEIEFARERKTPYYYLGYWVRDCGAMSYKANYRPHEILYPDGVWRRGAGDAGEGEEAGI